MTEERKKKRLGCFWVAVGLLAMAALAGTLLLGGLLLVGRTVTLPSHSGLGQDEAPDLKEVWSWGAGDTKVVVIPLKGVIFLDHDGDWLNSAAGTASSALLAIRRATHDEDVKAIILDVDSGGGGITASDILYKALLDFREAQDDRKIVAVFHDVAASGAYYVALAADYIVAAPTTITGSIGVLIQSFNVRELAQKVGVKDVTIKSGENKDILNPFNDLTETQKLMLQGIVDELYSRFVTLVSEGRGIPEDEVRQFADGRIFTATAAVDLGLVDEIGYWEDAVQKAADLLGVDEVKVYRYEERLSLSSLFRAAAKWNPASALFSKLSGTRLMYLWQL